MTDHDIALRRFADASAAAAEAVLDAMSEDQREHIMRLFHAGNSLALAHAIHPTGEGCITFEVIFHDGSRQVLASVSGKPPTFQ